MDESCIFCEIITGDAPATFVHEDEVVVAFMDINPVTPGHVLVIPRSHATDLLDVSAEDVAACSRLAQQMGKRAKGRLGADGVNLLNCSGEAAWQTVFHFHIHVIPRYKDDPSRDRIGAPWQTVTSTPDEIGQIGKLLS